MNLPLKTCCGPDCCAPVSETKDDQLIEAVRDKYAQTARSSLSSREAGVRTVAEAFGYTAPELASIPAEANMGLSCGNPIALANIKPGETVVDLGSGGGLDVFLAAQKIGPTGRAIGIDMTPDMIDRAPRAAARGTNGVPIGNVEFHLSAIDKLPLPDGSVDVIISNCVINLAPDKPAVFREMRRVLKTGGRLAISDIVLKKPLPPQIAQDVMAYVGCIAGAISVGDYETGLQSSGFGQVAVIDSEADLNAYAEIEGQMGCCSPGDDAGPATSSSCCGPAAGHEAGTGVHTHLRELIAKHDINEYAASVKIFAVKTS